MILGLRPENGSVGNRRPASQRPLKRSRVPLLKKGQTPRLSCSLPLLSAVDVEERSAQPTRVFMYVLRPYIKTRGVPTVATGAQE
ncbi:hypothetical protein NHX12_028102 [Muraenolepis orangiensis]|uniref:Uncharacterized protein n=1 Tax=Muraenolepis orangiensis TaxID=630683 RepID=A0A9Q0EFY1_9TELE|nr:hypothetical protein NHX12_028102 [Muraenolepis orangiensis]